MDNDLKMMVYTYKSLTTSQKVWNGDVLYMTDDMCCKKINRRLILQYEAFVLFCKDFVNNGGDLIKYMTYDQFKEKIGGSIEPDSLPKIKRRNKSYFVIGYCDVTNYLKMLNAYKHNKANGTKRMIMLRALQRFNRMGGAVKINDKIYVKTDPINYDSIK